MCTEQLPPGDYPIAVKYKIQGYSKVPPELPNSAAQQPRQTQQKGAYK
jgi:hypothetical protein